MAYRTLLAHLPDEDTADAVIGVSVELAERYGAHLTGLHVLPPLEPLGYYAYALPIAVDERFAEERAARAERVRRRFDEAVGAARFVAEWRLLESVGAPLENVVGRTANTADLLIAGLDPERSRRTRGRCRRRAPGARHRPGCRHRRGRVLRAWRVPRDLVREHDPVPAGSREGGAADVALNHPYSGGVVRVLAILTLPRDVVPGEREPEFACSDIEGGANPPRAARIRE